MLTENEIWRQGCAAVAREFQALTAARREQLRGQVAALMAIKSAMHVLVDKVAGSDQCALCRGECCKSGKYHVTAVDVLVYLVNGEPLFEPLFASGWCPFLDETGCMMPPAQRPFNCITFNCEKIEELLSSAELAHFYAREKELRLCYADIRRLFAGSALRGAVMHGESTVQNGRSCPSAAGKRCAGGG